MVRSFLCGVKYVSAIEEATALNRGIPCKHFKSVIKLYFSCFIFMVFLLYQLFIKGNTFFNVREKICRPLKQLRPKIGESLSIFKSLIKSYFSCSLFCCFPFFINKFIKGDIFIYVRENICSLMRQLRPEIGGSIVIFNFYCSSE